MKGYVIIVETSKYKTVEPVCGRRTVRRITTKTTLDNKVWRKIEDAQQRIRTIAFKKCEKHNYRKMYDNLSTIRANRLHSEMDYAIERDNYNTVKVYKIRPMQIG